MLKFYGYYDPEDDKDYSEINPDSPFSFYD